MFDLSINLGNLLTIVAYIAGGIALVVVMRRDVSQMSREMDLVKQELKTLTQVLIVQGRQDERITAIDQRMLNQGKRLDDTVRRLNTYLDLKSVNMDDDES